MASGANRMTASADFLSASRADLNWVAAAEAADDETAALGCEARDAQADMERVLYEHAYRSCEAVELLRASWCSEPDFRSSRAAVEMNTPARESFLLGHS
jgi:hypothetical protein